MFSDLSAALGPERAGRLVERARARLEDDAARLAGYAGHETPTGDGAALDALAERLLADGSRAGAIGRRVRPGADGRPATPGSGDALVLEHPGRGDAAALPPALLLAHHDTVHPRGSAGGDLPVARDGDVLRGPGVYDMKGGLVVALAALELLAELDVPHRPVRLLVTPDEEIGSPSSAGLVVDLARGVAYALGFEAPGPGGSLKTSRRGSTRLRLAVQGRAAHAAIDPASGVSAIDELVDQLLAVRAVVARHPDVLCNVGTLGGGGRANVVPAAAHADIGLRFLTAASEREVLAALGALTPVRPGAVVDPVVLTSRPAWEPSAAADALFAAVVRAGEAVGQRVTGAPAPGAADANLTGAAGVPTLDGFGPLGGGAHALSEHVLLPSLADRSSLVAAVLATV